MTLGAHLLGRIAPTDERHLDAYPYEARDPRSGKAIEVEIVRPTLSDYNQLQTPECVAFSISKYKNWCDKYAYSAPWLYARCKEIDGYPGDGTNARAACDVLRTLGHVRTVSGVPVKAGPVKAHGIAGNTWATTVDEIRNVFASEKPQPVLIGIDWLNAWFTPERSAVTHEFQLQAPSRGGGSAGGHEIGIWACSDKRQAFGLSNTWGDGWPPLVWMPYTTMDWLFARSADACVIQDLATR